MERFQHDSVILMKYFPLRDMTLESWCKGIRIRQLWDHRIEHHINLSREVKKLINKDEYVRILNMQLRDNKIKYHCVSLSFDSNTLILRFCRN